MSLFSQLLAQIGNTPGSSEAPDKDGVAGESLLDGLLAMVGGGGGLTNLVKNFQERGLGDVVHSWISTGENLPITPEQLEQGWGPDQVHQLAEQSGLPQRSVLPMLCTAFTEYDRQAHPARVCPHGRVSRTNPQPVPQ